MCASSHDNFFPITTLKLKVETSRLEFFNVKPKGLRCFIVDPFLIVDAYFDGSLDYYKIKLYPVI